tara:strand:+ start:699 stop:1190 length:492 start_codon:yes stop_codon:yes gene_type:complete
MSITNEEIVAIMKAFSSKDVKAARDLINNDSEVDIDLVFKVSGKLLRGQKPKPAKGTSTIPWKVAMALVIKRSGFTGPQSARLLADAITTAVSLNKDAAAELMAESGVGDALALVDRELFSKLPPIEKDGTIKFVGEAVAVRQPVLVVDNEPVSLGEDEIAAK